MLTWTFVNRCWSRFPTVGTESKSPNLLKSSAKPRGPVCSQMSAAMSGTVYQWFVQRVNLKVGWDTYKIDQLPQLQTTVQWTVTDLEAWGRGNDIGCNLVRVSVGVTTRATDRAGSDVSLIGGSSDPQPIWAFSGTPSGAFGFRAKDSLGQIGESL